LPKHFEETFGSYSRKQIINPILLFLLCTSMPLKVFLLHSGIIDNYMTLSKLCGEKASNLFIMWFIFYNDIYICI